MRIGWLTILELSNGEMVPAWIDSVGSQAASAAGTPTLAANSLGGRHAIQFNPSDGVDGFRVSAATNPLAFANDYSVAVVFATNSNNLVGANGDWFENSGLVDSNSVGLSKDWGVTINAAGQVAAGLGGGFGQPKANLYSTQTGLNDGNLHLAIFTRSGSDLSISIDGEIASTLNDANPDPRAPLDLVIGMLQNETNGFEGSIGQVRLYDGALDPSEIQSLHAEIDSYYDNQPPVAVDDQYSITEDQFFFANAATGVLVNDSDPDGDPLTAVLVETTPNGVLSLNDDGSFVYNPARDFFGTDSFTYAASDFRPGNVATVTIEIEPRYDPVLPVADSYIGRPGEVLNIPGLVGILANDLNPDNLDVTIEVVEDVESGLLTVNNDGSFQYDPQDFSGIAAFSYRVNDGTSVSSPATVTLRINSAPIAVNDDYLLDEDSTITVSAADGILSNDIDNEGDALTLTLIESTINGTLELADDGAFTYTPNANYAGPDLFTYRVSDGLESSARQATVSLSVREVNDTPVAVKDAYVLDSGESITVDRASGVLANDFDLDQGQILSAILVDQANRGTVTLSADGSFVYAADAAFVGADSFSYRVSDSVTQSNTVRVDLIFDTPRGNTSPSGDAVVTFNEIMYNPAGVDDSGMEWIELHNQMGIDMDISGWRLDGGVEFGFAEGTVIPGRGYLVVASNPEMLKTATGLDGLLGPFLGRLGNGGEELELRNNSNRVMDIVQFNDRGDWPSAADGSGASLAKRAAHFASGSAESWTHSENVNGTPSVLNFDDGAFESNLLINEVSSAADVNFQIELTNVGRTAIDLQGLRIASSNPAKQAVELPAQSLEPGAFLAIDEAQLGFGGDVDERVWLTSSDGESILDSQVVTNRLRGRSDRYDGDWLFPSEPTFGTANTFQIDDNIVINEIMYHAAGTYIESIGRYFESAEQWVEIYNRSVTETVDLSGWAFNRGINFTFGEAASLGPGSYLVIAKDPTAVLADHPNLTPESVLGPYGGSLANGGELLQLADASNNPVDQVHYYDDGRWSFHADGHGSSLELRDPFSDNRAAESWAPSNEAARSQWQTITYQGSGQNNGNDPQQYNEFLFGMLDAGEVLIDDVRVVENPGQNDAVQLIQNGTFENDSIGSNPDTWRIIGNQAGQVIVDPDDPGNQVLHLVSTGAMEHMHNNGGTTLKEGDRFHRLGNSQYEISFKARWMGGSNQLNSRLYFNRLPLTTRLEKPDGGGTPGMVNSIFESNIGPTYEGLIHSPVVPDVNEATTVSVFASDPQGVDSMMLWYSVAGGAFQSTSMSLATNGKFVGTIPGQGAGQAVQFYVAGQDSSGSMSMFPADGPASRALYRVQDGDAMDDVRANLRIVMTPDDTNFLHETTNVMSNGRIGTTVIYNESEVFYDIGVRLKGSQRGRNKDVRVGFNIQFDPQHLFRGVHKSIGIDRSGSGDEFSQKEIVVRQIINHAGNLPQIYDDLIHVIAPRSRHTGSAMLNMARYNDLFLDSMYENGSQGTAFEYELIYYPTSTTGGLEGLKRPNPDNVVGQSLRDLGDDKELYRYHFIIENNRQQDNYDQLIEAWKILGQRSSAENFHEDTQRVLDVDQWLRALAVQILAGIGDSYSAGSQHNAQFYARPDGKMLHFPWDMDFSFTSGTNVNLIGNGELRKLISDPGNEHNYYGHVYDIIQTTFNSDYMNRWVDHFTDLVPRQSYAGFKNVINRRSSSALDRVERAIARVPFETTTPATNVGDALNATVRGTGWVDVRSIWLQGEATPLEIEWTANDQWQVEIPVGSGTNAYVLEARDFQGNPISTTTVSVTSTGSTEVRNSLRISELNFNPADAAANELDLDNDEYEFIELINIGSSTIDLNGVRFVQVEIDGGNDGVEFTFDSQSLAAGERIVVARNPLAFASRYGNRARLADGFGTETGAYAGRLDNGGETITLLDAAGGTIHQFAYDDAWHPTTDGEGFSLELINPSDSNLENWSVAESWRASSNQGGSPGGGSDVIGDSNRDGIFDSGDLVLVFQAGEYEDGIEDNSTWEDGDWNGDGDFTTGDLVFAFQAGTFAAQAVALHSPGIARDNQYREEQIAAADLNGLSPEQKTEGATAPIKLDDSSKNRLAARIELTIQDVESIFAEREEPIEPVFQAQKMN